MSTSSQGSTGPFPDINFQTLQGCRRTVFVGAFAFGLIGALPNGEVTLQLLGMSFEIPRVLLYFSSLTFLFASAVAYVCFLLTEFYNSKLMDDVHRRPIFIGSASTFSNHSNYDDFAHFREVCRARISEIEFESIVPLNSEDSFPNEPGELLSTTHEDFLQEVKKLGCPKLVNEREGKFIRLEIGRYDAACVFDFGSEADPIIHLIDSLETLGKNILAKSKWAAVISLIGRTLPFIAIGIACLAQLL